MTVPQNPKIFPEIHSVSCLLLYRPPSWLRVEMEVGRETSRETPE